jgi:2-methylaconitate isomerase
MEAYKPIAETIPFRACWMRGGTSKGVFFLEKELPPSKVLQDEIILAALGSPDVFGTQIDGLGGATSSTSKAAIISISEREDCDINYCFAHVSVREGIIDYSGNCGNLSAAVGLFALEEKLVKGQPKKTVVAVWQENLQQRFLVEVPTDEQGAPLQYGGYAISGVPGTGARISITFKDPVPKHCKHVLPTQHPIDSIVIPDLGSIQVSIVASGNPTVFVEAGVLGLSGDETPAELNQSSESLALIERVRVVAALHAGLISSLSEASQQPATPKIAVVSKPHAYSSTSGEVFDKKAMNISSRFFFHGESSSCYPCNGSNSISY